MDWGWKERGGGLGVLRRGGVGRLGFVERSESTACSSIVEKVERAKRAPVARRPTNETPAENALPKK